MSYSRPLYGVSYLNPIQIFFANDSEVIFSSPLRVSYLNWKDGWFYEDDDT